MHLLPGLLPMLRANVSAALHGRERPARSGQQATDQLHSAGSHSHLRVAPIADVCVYKGRPPERTVEREEGRRGET